MDALVFALASVTVLALLATGVALGLLWARRHGGDVATAVALERRGADDAVLRAGIERLGDQLSDLERSRAAWQGQLQQQVLDMRATTESLGRETRSLATALRRPQVRGRWGEMHLRRAVEVAGLVDRCDFAEQVHLAAADADATGDPSTPRGALRPDLVVSLAGGRSVVVDAKVPLEAFLDATATEDDEEHTLHLRRHARQVRTHIDHLAAKRYWRALPCSPEFVVLFVPGDSFLAAALEADADLIEYAADRQVVLATPTTLIALLRTVALGWRQEVLVDQASEIQRLGRDLHDRLGTLTSHLDAVGRSLGAAVGHYNQAVGSYQSRVLVAARRFSELAVADGALATPRQVDAAPRSIEVLDADHPLDPPAARRPAVGEGWN